MSVVSLYDQATKKLNYLDGIAPLLLRLYLAPIFIQAGWTKFQNFEQKLRNSNKSGSFFGKKS